MNGVNYTLFQLIARCVQVTIMMTMCELGYEPLHSFKSLRCLQAAGCSQTIHMSTLVALQCAVLPFILSSASGTACSAYR